MTDTTADKVPPLDKPTRILRLKISGDVLLDCDPAVKQLYRVKDDPARGDALLAMSDKDLEWELTDGDKAAAELMALFLTNGGYRIQVQVAGASGVELEAWAAANAERRAARSEAERLEREQFDAES